MPRSLRRELVSTIPRRRHRARRPRPQCGSCLDGGRCTSAGRRMDHAAEDRCAVLSDASEAAAFDRRLACKVGSAFGEARRRESPRRAVPNAAIPGARNKRPNGHPDGRKLLATGVRVPVFTSQMSKRPALGRSRAGWKRARRVSTFAELCYAAAWNGEQYSDGWAEGLLRSRRSRWRDRSSIAHFPASRGYGLRTSPSRHHRLMRPRRSHPHPRLSSSGRLSTGPCRLCF